MAVSAEEDPPARMPSLPAATEALASCLDVGLELDHLAQVSGSA